MKRFQIILIAGLSLLATHTNAQIGCKTIIKDGTSYQKCYFANGKLSTEISNKLDNKNWHHLVAFDQLGNVIYEKEYGLKWGVSHIDVTYHKNGALYSAHYTFQPDGGIQYTNIISYFTPEGKLDHEEDNSLGNDGSPKLVTEMRRSFTETPVKKKETIACTPIPVNTEVCLINHTSDLLQVKAQSLDSATKKSIVKLVEPSDTLQIGVYNATTAYDKPSNHYSLYITNKVRKGYQYQINYIGGVNGGKQYMEATYRRIKKYVK